MIGDMTLELHLRNECREKYSLKELSFSETGKTLLEGNYQIQDMTENFNKVKRLNNVLEDFYHSSDINALALIERINHYIISRYLRESDNLAFRSSLNTLYGLYGEKTIDSMLRLYNSHFSGTPGRSLDEPIDNVPAREKILEEVVLLKICNSNRAALKYREIFDDTPLAEKTPYTPAFYTLLEHFDKTPSFGNYGSNLLKLLLEPAQKHPESLQSQIEYMKEMWTFLTDDFLLMLLKGIDLINEENKIHFSGPGPTAAMQFGTYHNSEDEDNPNYSPDSNWMPEVILLAKNALVWLTQLSRDYKREIKRLDQIPDEELDTMASRGINCLWLIGIWNRSKASREIKRRCGNHDAVSSAYSLFSYDIDWEIGGWDALANLRERCRSRGIRLASDMVPNHTGIDSEWTRSRPDWFIQTDRPPFPSYRYNSENLSEDPGIGIYLEDHYYDKSDAAVTFKRVNFHNGETRYIYHGNDGTSMPWNDTAQLDFLKAEVREAVIGEILHVARNFPVIRFDAAMTLAKKHIQRLWYPLPGQGGDIASRSNFALTAHDFEEACGGEFWKEVVTRVASEAPDTLLLAEAFWMMEGYFVRNLGMHRVYNSAFMNMLKNEENGKYKETIKNTLNYDRKILKRFVNFMNNPDEDTAAVQFGTGDKYFGVLTLMLTMPGLPMIGHGQIEGYREKYGMEFHKPLWDEYPDPEMVARHEREIFPIMKRRYLFVSANKFRLYDLIEHSGAVNDNVFAYSNRCGSEYVLVLYNNAYERAVGMINHSAPFIEEDGKGSRFESSTLGESLGLSNDKDCYCVVRELKSGLWFIRNSRAIYEQGLYVELDGFKSQVFMDIHELRDSDANRIADICGKLNGAGTPDLDREYREMIFQPLYRAYGKLINREILSALKDEKLTLTGIFEKRNESLLETLNAVKEFAGGTGKPEEIASMILASLSRPDSIAEKLIKEKKAAEYFRKGYSWQNRVVLYLFSLFRYTGRLIGPADKDRINRDILDNWMINHFLRDLFSDMGWKEIDIDGIISLFRFLQERYSRITEITETPLSVEFLENLTDMEGFRQLLGMNTYEGTLWFNRERFTMYLWWSFYCAMLEKDRKEIDEIFKKIPALEKAAEKSEYDFDKLLKLMGKESLP
ncbi:MAG: hypothetical protein JXR86_10550 [Spirochaetales bacterium]|nr:hypothetical protein [Spirochaetales bacterium]